MAEAKTASLTVLGGPLAGLRSVLPESGTLTIGSSPGSGLHLDLPTVSPYHARVVVEEGRVTVHDTGAGAGGPRQRQPARARAAPRSATATSSGSARPARTTS